MIEIQSLYETIKACLFSAYLKEEKPLSLLIVAKAESGKTQSMKTFRENKGIIYMTDCTAYGLTRDILPKLVSGEVKTLMISDMITPLSRSTKTRKNFVAFINNLIEEGIAKMTTYATIWEKEVNCNVITAVTDVELKDARHEWAKMGFLSRFLIFSYSYPISKVMKILDFLSKPNKDKINLKFPQETTVTIPEEISKRLNPFATALGSKMELYGFRAKINFQTFLKALTLMNKRTVVNEEDFKRFEELSTYFNFDFNPL